MEGLICWHTFYDGNKRTGLAVGITYMYRNNLRLVLPLDAVRFSVLVADNKVTFNELVKWIKDKTAHTPEEYVAKYTSHIAKPAMEILGLLNSGDEEKKRLAFKKLDYALAIDIYPQYKINAAETVEFLSRLATKYTPSGEF